MDANINLGLYRNMEYGVISNSVQMYRDFKTGGSMDYKQGGNAYVDFGNFNYGAYSIAVGRTAMDTITNSDAYSLYTNHTFDQPQDMSEIKAGIAYAKCRIGQ